MTDRELMQQALDALGWTDEWRPDGLKEQTIAALRERLAQPEQERWVWRNAAIRVGEELSSVGPVGYYDMTAAQWFDWAMAQEPRGKNSLAQPDQKPMARAWDEGYRQGVEDECISAANIGIAGFGAKVKPARQNPYKTTTPQRKPEQEPIKESSVTHSHLWIGDLYGEGKNT